MFPGADEVDLEKQIRAARMRMLLDHVDRGMVVSALFTCVIGWLIHTSVPDAKLWPWLTLKLLVVVPRFVQARWFMQRARPVGRRAFRWMLVFLALDGVAWGTLGWWMTPVMQLELGVITMNSMMGVAAIGSFRLASDVRAVSAFLLPMLVPNIAFCLTRQDSLGWFAATSIFTFMLVMHLESVRGQRRISELLRLRFTTERVAGERALALEQAKHHSEAKSRFLATVSHEMRTPLHGIMGLARVLQQEQARTDQRQRLSLIERSGEHLLMVINDILDFSKIEAGRMEIDARPFDLTALLQDAEGVFHVLAQRKNLCLNLSTSWTGPCEVMGDPGRVRQVLHNLLGNAVKFTQAGHIQLLARREGTSDRFEITVQDTGHGIAAPDLERIFEAFTQSNASRQHHHGGTGLGLSISRQLCQAMDGTLSCDSVEGVGSTFSANLRLPPVTEHCVGQTGSRCAVDGRSGFSGLKVLQVEDNPVNVVVADAVLVNLGCQVVTVSNGMQAVDWLDEHQCDVVLMDCAMPVMDGFAATREIRRRERVASRGRVPIIALTANVLSNERAQCIEAGMDDYVPKPFNTDDIRQVLDRVMVNAPLLRSA